MALQLGTLFLLVWQPHQQGNFGTFTSTASFLDFASYLKLSTLSRICVLNIFPSCCNFLVCLTYTERGWLQACTECCTEWFDFSWTFHAIASVSRKLNFVIAALSIDTSTFCTIIIILTPKEPNIKPMPLQSCRMLLAKASPVVLLLQAVKRSGILF